MKASQATVATVAEQESRKPGDGLEVDAATAGAAEDLAAGERVRLRDGRIVELRQTVDADKPELRAFLGELSPEARHLRFFTAAVDLDTAAHWAVATGEDRCGLLAREPGGALVGHAAFIQPDSERAEVAVEVADRLHGDSLGTILIERIAVIAEARGISQFVAEVLPENRAMLEVFCDGFDAQLRLRDGTDSVEFPTAAWRFARERFRNGARQRLSKRLGGVEASRLLLVSRHSPA